ncbi:MAG TPA: tetratricopeptide repeat protein [Kofleriaceae bacterium]|nr:tetratricopeptide repeat protein [Kofleriaceae bacterium]
MPVVLRGAFAAARAVARPVAVAFSRPLPLAVAAALAALSVACAGSQPPAPPRRPSAPRVEPLPPLSAQAYRHYLRGRLAAIEGDQARAATELREAAAAASDQPAIRVALADALLRSGSRDEAVREIEGAHARFPRDAGVWRESGRVYRRVGREAEAALAYQRAIELDPLDEDSYLGLASVWLSLARPGKAEATYRALLGRRPLSVAGHYRLGLRLLARGSLTDADRAFRRAVDLDPSHTRARVGLARVLRARGRPRAALTLLREAFDRSSSVDIGESLFEQLLEVGERDAAVALLGQLDRDDLEIEVRASFGYLYLQVGEAEAARRLAARLLTVAPTSGALRLLEARALVDLGRGGEAIRGLLAVGPGVPAYGECRALAAELLARAGRAAEARTAIERALAQLPEDIDLVIGRALVAELGGRAADARALLRAAIAARAGRAAHADSGARADSNARADDLVYALARLEDRQGQPDAAVALAQRILDRDPEHAAALNFIGFSLADRGRDLPRAERMLQRALELSPTDANVLDSMGWLRFRQRRLDAAGELLERAARLAPAEPEILWHLGELLLARRESRRALAIYEKARALRPDEPVRRRIEDRIHALQAQR